MTSVGGTGVPPLGAFDDASSRGLYRLFRWLAERLEADGRNLPRYVVRYTVVVLALTGVVGLWEACGDGRIPMVVPLRTPIDPHHVSSAACAAEGTSDAVRWRGLAPVVAILDEVDPQVAAWVRQCHDRGAIVFSDDYAGKPGKPGAFAKYDHFQRKLMIHRALFEENDGTVAAILCHEYRHSRQSMAKVFKYALSFMFARGGDPAIVENDAELYEHEASVAIFGH